MKSQAKPRPSYRVGPYLIDGRASEVRKDHECLPLSGVEFEVLYQLVERRGELILRGEFKPWDREGSVDRRNPVDTAVVQIRKQLEDSIIKTERGRGYRLGAGFVVELIASPSSSELGRLLAIALNQVNDHSSASFRGAIENCEELLKAERIPDAYAVLGLAYINQGHVGLCREQPSVAIAKAREIINEGLKYFPSFGSAYAMS
jgi:DNA-binding winged helix-turn-helix (wHTH) protein